MIDGVHKFFLVYHEHKAMHFEGEETLIGIADLALRKLTTSMTPHERKMVMEVLNERMEKCFESWEDPEPAES